MKFLRKIWKKRESITNTICRVSYMNSMGMSLFSHEIICPKMVRTLLCTPLSLISLKKQLFRLTVLKFKNIFKSVVWGGEKIAPFKGVNTQQKNIGESWELSGVKGNESIVAEGPLAGRTITSLAEEYKGALLGEKVYADTGTEFPLLIKFIDARDDLSIQVHPDDKLAAERHNGSKGKTEMWYVISHEKGAGLYVGLKEDSTKEEIKEALETLLMGVIEGKCQNTTASLKRYLTELKK